MEGNPPFVVSENNNGVEFGAGSLLTLSEVEIFGRNYWLAAYGEDGEFVLDLAERAGPLNTVELVNTHNADYKNWATKEFKVFLGNSSSGPWEEVVHQTLEDSREQTDPRPVKRFPFEKTEAQFVRFQQMSFYGSGGGLQYFAVNFFFAGETRLRY